jgi:N-acyl homoserine lactone hydrolase
VATAAEPQPASLPLPGGREGASVRVTPLITGTMLLQPGWMHAPEGRFTTLKALGIGVPRSEWVRVPIPAFLIEHPGAEAILVDTGFHASVAVRPRENLGRFGAWWFKGIEMEETQAVTAHLRERGIEPAGVRVVILTHLHLDHASAISDFPRATFLLSTDEWRSATESQPWKRGYHPRQFDHAFDYRLLDFDAPEADSFASFGRSFDVFGDGSVRVVSTPGHTAGHMSVVARLSNERELLIVGDAAYTERAIREGLLQGRPFDEHFMQRSLREIQLYAEQTPNAVIVPGHDPDVFARLERVYE